MDIPRHVAIIMDGNGRWAQKRGLPRIAGHRVGIKRVKEIIKAAQDLGIEVLTLFAFSSENWQRSKKEVSMLMLSLENFLKKNSADLMKNNISLKVIGREEPLPKNIIRLSREVVDKTKGNSSLKLCLALNYGSRQEIIDAVRRTIEYVNNNRLNAEEINDATFSQFLYTNGLPDPDLLIRTSGEQRISNFLLWQISYAELYFAKKFWPDFTAEDLKKAVREFQRRARRFGKLNDEEDN